MDIDEIMKDVWSIPCFSRIINSEHQEGFVFNQYEGYWQESDEHFRNRIKQYYAINQSN